mmetsp:Transcript_84289/g.233615  ORF Transcript_84289/g.233615 Transcript_84289/m.233615 type:complete len:293 (-) Transcript_84289:1352-2230(-)
MARSGSGRSVGLASMLAEDIPVRSAGKPLGADSKSLLCIFDPGDASRSTMEDFEPIRLGLPSNRLEPFLGDAASNNFVPNRLMLLVGLTSIGGGGCKRGESSSTCSTRMSPAFNCMAERWPGGTGRWSRCIAMMVAWYSVGKSMSATTRPTSHDCSLMVPRSTARPRLFDTCMPAVVSSRVRMTVDTSSIFSASEAASAGDSISQRQMEMDRWPMTVASDRQMETRNRPSPLEMSCSRPTRFTASTPRVKTPSASSPPSRTTTTWSGSAASQPLPSATSAVASLLPVRRHLS